MWYATEEPQYVLSKQIIINFAKYALSMYVFGVVFIATRVFAWEIHYSDYRSPEDSTVFLSVVSSKPSACSIRPPVMLLVCQENRLEAAYFGNACPPAYSKAERAFIGSMKIDGASLETVRFESHSKSPGIFGDNSLNSAMDDMLDFGMVLPKVLTSRSLSIQYPSASGRNEEFSFETRGLQDIKAEAKLLCGL